MARKGQFKKGGGRHGGGGGTKSRALVKTKTKYVTRHSKAKPRRRGKHGGSGGVTLGKILITGAALGFLFTERTPVQQLRTFAEKIPGAKTFGAPAVVGGIALGIDHFFKRSPWLRAAGYVGIALAAAKLGEQNKDFKFLGDVDDDEFVGDVD